MIRILLLLIVCTLLSDISLGQGRPGTVDGGPCSGPHPPPFCADGGGPCASPNPPPSCQGGGSPVPLSGQWILILSALILGLSKICPFPQGRLKGADKKKISTFNGTQVQ
jgi:hypothetical protein